MFIGHWLLSLVTENGQQLQWYSYPKVSPPSQLARPVPTVYRRIVSSPVSRGSGQRPPSTQTSSTGKASGPRYRADRFWHVYTGRSRVHCLLRSIAIGSLHWDPNMNNVCMYACMGQPLGPITCTVCVALVVMCVVIISWDIIKSVDDGKHCISGVIALGTWLCSCTLFNLKYPVQTSKCLYVFILDDLKLINPLESQAVKSSFVEYTGICGGNELMWFSC